MRFLCLHGMGSSAQIFQNQLSLVQEELGQDHEFVFAQGEIETCAGPGMEGVSTGPYYTFFELPCRSQLRAAFDLIEEYCQYEGPFEGIIGFSLGASLAASYLLHIQTANDSTSSATFKCAILFCANLPFDLESRPFTIRSEGTFEDTVSGGILAEEEITHTMPELKDLAIRARYARRGEPILRRHYPHLNSSMLIRIPTLHICGVNDEYYSQSVALQQLCEPTDMKIIEHKRGHCIPQDQSTTSRISDCIRHTIHATESG